MKILHLSDIHFGRDYKRTRLNEPFENRKKIMDSLIMCVGNIEKPEHIVVTGDIAWFGKKDEYDEAREWFIRLLKVTGLSGKDITFCVGNHDINRNHGKIIDSLTDRTICEIDRAYEYRNVCNYEAPIENYENFCHEIGMEPYKYYVDGKVEYSYAIGYKDVEFPSGNTIRFVAFNTAMLSYGKNISQEKMWIGQAQIHDLMSYGILPKSRECKYSVALLHHAERFLHPNEICEYDGRVATLPLLMNNVDLVLCGHTETGGVPVLRTQEGGGKILTAGATYYNDEHPNSFSMLYIPNEGNGLAIGLYLYDEDWKLYQSKEKTVKIEKIKEIPEMGNIEEECKFVISADGKEYTIPMKHISVHIYDKDGISWCSLENNKDVTRQLKIECQGPVNGGKAIANVSLPTKKAEDVSSLLARDRYFWFLQNVVSKSKKSEFCIINNQGVKILYGNNMHIEDTELTDKESIEILEKLLLIENYFEIKLVRPDEIYEEDMKKINVLVELITKGYTKNISIGNIIDFTTGDYDWLMTLYDRVNYNNSIRIYHEGKYECELLGKRFKIDNVVIVSELYKLDIDDLKYKIDTYREGDSRSIKLFAGEYIDTRFIIDGERNDEQEFDTECITINVNHMGISNGFIREIE